MFTQDDVPSAPPLDPLAFEQAQVWQQELGQRLREDLDVVLTEPTPPDFLDLIRRAASRMQARARG